MPTTRIGFDDGGGVLGRDALIQFGPTIHVQIGFDPDFRPDIAIPPNVPSTVLPALVDTGAQYSCIDSALAARLLLPVVDRQRIAGVMGHSETDIHVAQIYVPALQITEYGRFAGVHLQAGGQPHFALMGRSFLSHFVMSYEGLSGTVTLGTGQSRS